MNDILIKNNSTRSEIVKFIMNLLINVNKDIILPYRKNLKSEDISTKTSNDDFVSIADKKTEEIIIKHLRGFFNVSDILGEETAFFDKQYGGAGRIRTCYLLVRSQTLYPNELQPLLEIITLNLITSSAIYFSSVMR